jgi:hypothetical protein
VTTYAAANRFVHGGYLREHNARFARPPGSPEDVHRRRPSRTRLDQIFVVHETRTLSNDWVVQYRNRLLQLERPSGRMPARSTVQVCEARDGTVTIRYRERALPWRELVPGHPTVAASRPPVVAASRLRGPRAGADHPWRQGYEHMRSGSASVWQAIRE